MRGNENLKNKSKNLGHCAILVEDPNQEKTVSIIIGRKMSLNKTVRLLAKLLKNLSVLVRLIDAIIRVLNHDSKKPARNEPPDNGE